ncbi:SWIM zinc finger family protein [uncultured Anaerococcus sp.]|uniref:SWIM zinc finger family protein n=1 Tax=uncultured Anaerococcus sp. TaxID=293428 RepID=UPI00280B77AA|nr:SWIM zinc finger family protein [uncultured Anaerococcus sp.]
MTKRLKIAYGLFAFSILGVIIGASQGKIISGLIGALPFLLLGIYFYLTKNKIKEIRKDEKILNKWSSWDLNLHNSQSQERKQVRALDLTPYKLDKDNLQAEFVSKDTGEIYITSLNSCTCESFKREKVPCKHMYALAYTLEVFKPKFEKSTDQSEKERALHDFSTLDRECKYLIAYEHIPTYSWSFLDKEISQKLLDIGFVITTDDLNVILPKLTKDELYNILDNHNISYKKSFPKSQIIELLIMNKDKVLNDDLKAKLPLPIKLNEDIVPYLGSFRGKYANEYSKY